MVLMNDTLVTDTLVTTTNSQATAKDCPCAPCRSRRSNAEQRAATMLQVQVLREKGFRVDLPDGEHAVMRDPEMLTEAQRAALKEARATVELIGDHLDKAINDGRLGAVELLIEREAAARRKTEPQLVATFVKSWSFEVPAPQPHVPEAATLVPSHAFDKLLKVASDLMVAAWYDAEPTDMDADSPFVDSDSSKPTS